MKLHILDVNMYSGFVAYTLSHAQMNKIKGRTGQMLEDGVKI